MGFFGLNSFLACFHGRRVMVSLATSHRRVAVLWVELFLGLLSRQESYGFFGYFPQKVAVLWVELFLGLLSRQERYGFFGYFPQKVAVLWVELLACIHGRRVTVSLATSHGKLRFFGLN